VGLSRGGQRTFLQGKGSSEIIFILPTKKKKDNKFYTKMLLRKY